MWANTAAFITIWYFIYMHQITFFIEGPCKECFTVHCVVNLHIGYLEHTWKLWYLLIAVRDVPQTYSINLGYYSHSSFIVVSVNVCHISSSTGL